MSKFNVGDKVKFLGTDAKYACFYPSVGTIGVVNMAGKESCRCEWPEEHPEQNGKGNYTWWVRNTEIELVEENQNMTNEEIWEMLESKMQKNGLISKANLVYVSADNYPNDKIKITKTYLEDDVHNAIALAYKVGYLRAMKGRPFKIGEKKKKGGHWEPVDPNNLPKEGTKVKYSRECEDYADSDGYICINDTGAIKLEGSWFGVTLDNPHRYKWICFDNAEDCLDMWVEDDE